MSRRVVVVCEVEDDNAMWDEDNVDVDDEDDNIDVIRDFLGSTCFCFFSTVVLAAGGGLTGEDGELVDEVDIE